MVSAPNRSKDTKESSSKIKALNDTILRMNENNVKLSAENKSLREDLERLMNEAADIKEKKSTNVYFSAVLVRAKGKVPHTHALYHH